MKNVKRIANHHYSLAFLRLCAKIFGILLFVLTLASCPYEPARFPELPGTIRIIPDTEVPVNTQITVEYTPKYSEEVSYSWSQDGTEIPGETSATFTPQVPGLYTVTLSAHFFLSATRTILAIIPPQLANLSGAITISSGNEGSTRLELTASYDGDETVTYQWNLDGIAIPDAVDYCYMPQAAGVYTVTVSVAGYNSLTSAPVSIIERRLDGNDPSFDNDLVLGPGDDPPVDNNPASRLGALVSIPTLSAKTADSITVNTVTLASDTGQTIEYAISDSNSALPTTGWGASPTFGGLNPGRTYYVWARSVANDSYDTGIAAVSAGIATDKAPGATVDAPTEDTKTHESITIHAVAPPGNGQTVEYSLGTSSDPTLIWQSGLEFTGLFKSSPYYLYARSKENETYYAGLPSRGPVVTTTPEPGEIKSSTVNGVLIELAWIPAGTFMMGSPVGEPGRDDTRENPQHEVTLTSGFYMGIYQVTQEQYFAVTGLKPSYHDGSSLWFEAADGEEQVKRPVERVSWYDALVFCNRLSKEDGLSPAYSIDGSTDPDYWIPVPTANNDPTWDAVDIVTGATGYRLPTEAQWEYACRAGESAAFNDGTVNWNTTTAVELLGWYSSNSGSPAITHEVGKMNPNHWGLYDMHGNVYEWCWDRYAAYQDGPGIDPTGAITGDERMRRGGSWYFSAEYARSASRNETFPGVQSSYVGLRIIRP